MIKIKRYKKYDINRIIDKKLFMRGWTVMSEKEVGGYSTGKGLLLGLLWLPLALFGGTKYIEVTYEKK